VASGHPVPDLGTPAGAVGRRRWWPFLVVVLSVAAEMVVAGAPTEAAARPAVITAITGLAGLAILVSFAWSMGLARESLTLRLIAAVPVALSVALIVVLMLESHHRAGVRMPGWP
jgi:hypothetical protein